MTISQGSLSQRSDENRRGVGGGTLDLDGGRNDDK